MHYMSAIYLFYWNMNYEVMNIKERHHHRIRWIQLYKALKPIIQESSKEAKGHVVSSCWNFLHEPPAYSPLVIVWYNILAEA